MAPFTIGNCGSLVRVIQAASGERSPIEQRRDRAGRHANVLGEFSEDVASLEVIDRVEIDFDGCTAAHADCYFISRNAGPTGWRVRRPRRRWKSCHSRLGGL